MFSEGIAMLRSISLLFDWSDLPALTGVSFPRQPRLQIAEHDASIFQLARLLAAALEDDYSVTTQVMGENYVKTLVSAILLRAGGASCAATGVRRRGGLSGAQLRVVMQALENDSRRPDVAKLAGTVGLSESHFYRAFKQATGETPYRWHLCARIRRAQDMLRQPGAEIAQVASDAGFADQSHFTRTFKEIVGSTPHAWLRAARNPPLHAGCHADVHDHAPDNGCRHAVLNREKDHAERDEPAEAEDTGCPSRYR
jgi:AraC-like DNA-binding protein